MLDVYKRQDIHTVVDFIRKNLDFYLFDHAFRLFSATKVIELWINNDFRIKMT